MWTYQIYGYADKATVLKELERLIDGTEGFTPVMHMLVDEDNKIVALNIGGGKAAINFAKIVETQNNKLPPHGM